MLQANLGPARRQKTDYHKWAAGVLVPVAVAALGLFKTAGGGVTTTPNNSTIITNISIIENQYQQMAGQPLTDKDTKETIQKAVNLAKAGLYEDSRKLFEQVAVTVPVPAVYNNLGALSEAKGDYRAAKQAFRKAIERDPDYQPVRRNMAALAKLEEAMSAPVPVKGRGARLNNDIAHASQIGLGAGELGEITPDRADFFQFKTSRSPRDFYLVSIENGSTTLQPSLTVYDGNRSQVGNKYSYEALARLEYQFAAQPDSLYYAQLAGLRSSAGSYKLEVKPLKRYDSFEPDDDISQAKPIPIGKTIEANIMDGDDMDFYQLKSPGSPEKLIVSLENGSTTLQPSLTVYNGNRSQIGNNYSYEAVARLEYQFDSQPDSTYYVHIAGMRNSAGTYKLIINRQS